MSRCAMPTGQARSAEASIGSRHLAASKAATQTVCTVDIKAAV
jgi:hypothetical protein